MDVTILVSGILSVTARTISNIEPDAVSAA